MIPIQIDYSSCQFKYKNPLNFNHCLHTYQFRKDVSHAFGLLSFKLGQDVTECLKRFLLVGGRYRDLAPLTLALKNP